jgi:hypothetical protein
MIDAYTRLLEVAAEAQDEKVAEIAIKKLIVHLKSAGRVKMLGQIARKLRTIDARRRALAPVVEVASEREAARALKDAAAHGIVAKKARVNHSLIKGYRARSRGALVDRSAKAALVRIYQNVTH